MARRVTSPACSFEAVVEFRPLGFQHLAGITAYYNTRNWHFLFVTVDDHGERVLRAVTCDRGVLTAHAASFEVGDAVRLGLTFDGGELAFRYDAGSGRGSFVEGLDATIVSDEHAIEFENGQIRALGFTGAFVGMWVWDLTGHGHYADFMEMTYVDH